jgi:hypothetical protein
MPLIAPHWGKFKMRSIFGATSILPVIRIGRRPARLSRLIKVWNTGPYLWHVASSVKSKDCHDDNSMTLLIRSINLFAPGNGSERQFITFKGIC